MLKMFVTEPLCYQSKMLFTDFNKLFVTQNTGRGAPLNSVASSETYLRARGQ